MSSRPAESEPRYEIKTPKDLVDQLQEKWRVCEGLPETTLLRLAILRDLVADFHAEQSRCLAQGNKELAQEFSAWEARANSLRGADQLHGGLAESLSRTTPFKLRTRLLPSPLLSLIPREKLDRYDRVWEAAIAAEAVSLGWCFWNIHCWVRIRDIAPWNGHLVDRLIPHGVLLFTEEQERAPTPPEAVPLSEAWAGAWTVVLKPQYRTPDFGVGKIPGSLPGPRSPEWRLLYTPKNR